MNEEIIKITLTYLLPVFLAIGAGIASGAFGNKKKGMVNKKVIKELLDEICNECSFRNSSKNAEKVEKRMTISIRALIKLLSVIKADFLKYCVEKKICPKEEVLEINTFSLFENTFDSSIKKVLNELRTQFLKDGIDNLNTFEIDNRSNLLWNIITEIFDKYYKTNERPGRIELYELFEEKKPSYTNILNSIYEQSKNINF